MTTKQTNRRVVLAARPKGVPDADHFAVEDVPVQQPGAGEVLIEADWWSVDPAMRGWVNDVPNYLPPVAIGEVMRAFSVGRVVKSEHPDYVAGDCVTGLFGWQRYACVKGEAIDRKVMETDLPSSLALGLLGLNGITAYLCLTQVCEPKPGETVVVSTAAGAVGSAAGQIAKSLGCRTIGIAGGAEKVRLCLEDYHYDGAIDYRNDPVLDSLRDMAPDKIDCYFDNTCGPISDAVMQHLAIGARIAICGTAAITDWDPIPMGPRVHRQLLVARARIQGFLIFDHKDQEQGARDRLADMIRGDQITYREHVLEGADAARGAIGMLYRGENRGKLLVRPD